MTDQALLRHVIVSGNVQKMGFRAMILKQAIKYNLAGSAQNTQEGTLQSTLLDTFCYGIAIGLGNSEGF